MKIKEMAKKLNISPRAIRFYEEKGLIAPPKQPDNQYRTFSDQEAWRLQTIISLREVGMKLGDIKKALAEIDRKDPHEIQYLLELQRAAMFTQWLEWKQMIDTTDRMIALLKLEQTLDNHSIYELAEGSRRLRESRTSWRDRWSFDQKADNYDERLKEGASDTPRSPHAFHPHLDYEKALDQTVLRVSPIKGEIGLDIGVGTGNLAGRFLSEGITMKGIDQSREMLNQCRYKYPIMETKVGNFLALPFFDGQFDFAVTSFALHHLTPEQQLLALEEMNRVLKPHGRLCITDLMFADEAMRARSIQQLKSDGHWQVVAEIEDKHYADRSALLRWLEEHAYMTHCQQINELLHIVYAVRIR